MPRTRKKECVGILVAAAAFTVFATVAIAISLWAYGYQMSAIVTLCFACVAVVLCEYFTWDLICNRGWRIGSLAPIPSLFAYIALSIFAGIVLEFGTLVGALSATPLNIADWQMGRLVIFSILAYSLGITVLWLRRGASRCRKSGVLARARGVICQIPVMKWALTAGLVVAAIAVAFPIADIAGLSLKSTLMASVSAALIAIAFVFLCHTASDHPEYLFFIIVMILGTYIIAALPSLTFVSYDDEIHYARVVQLSYMTNVETSDVENALRSPQVVDGKELGRPNVGLESRANRLNITQEEIDYYQHAIDESAASASIRYTGESYEALSYVYIAYCPSAVGLWIARLIHLPFSLQFQVGKWFNLLFYALVCALAIRMLPVRKLLAAAIAAVPGCVFLAANYTYDSWIISLYYFLAHRCS